MNPERTTNELRRRYEEVVISTQQELKSPQQYEQMLTVISHYMQFMNERKILLKAIQKLKNKKDYLKTDKEIVMESSKLIDLLQGDSRKLEKIARKEKLPLSVRPSDTGRIPNDQRFALTLNSIKMFLKHEDKQIYFIPEHLGNLRVLVWELRKKGVNEKILEPFSDPYTPLQNDFAKKLRLYKLYENYLRLNDFRALDDVKRFVYEEMSGQNEELLDSIPKLST